ncbi:hypothetical protein F2P81_022988 [Scophthalmus maximus]|uniref:Uncharacterized protein n=1 Tax=Scophthalmus maximus TaxID=52904 RepID=A0A6A4RNS8_SCOMX|nr:hypothetical protein F2P81_022988 [Scophthalmus maximus]
MADATKTDFCPTAVDFERPQTPSPRQVRRRRGDGVFLTVLMSSAERRDSVFLLSRQVKDSREKPEASTAASVDLVLV